MTLLKLWELLLRLTGITATIEALTLATNTMVANYTKAFNSIVQPITDIHDAVTDVAHGNVAIKAALDSMTGSGAYDLNAILAAIAALPAGSNIVVPTAGDNAAGVWGYLGTGWQQFAGTYLRSAGAFAINANLAAALPLAWQPDFAVYGMWDSDDPNLNVYRYPQPNWGGVIAGDTRLSWLQRTDPDSNWEDGTGRGDPMMRAAPPSYVWKIAPTFSEGQFQEYVRSVTAKPLAPPIWPGIAGVTLGTTVPAVVSTVLELPMDGIIWLTTSYPPARARWGAAPYYSVYHTGRLAFITDNGDLEPFQYMGWQSAVYVPQTMGRAAGVVVFLEANIEGAITPWDISV
jgi:hypothetical protein